MPMKLATHGDIGWPQHHQFRHLPFDNLLAARVKDVGTQQRIYIGLGSVKVFVALPCLLGKTIKAGDDSLLFTQRRQWNAMRKNLIRLHSDTAGADTFAAPCDGLPDRRQLKIRLQESRLQPRSVNLEARVFIRHVVPIKAFVDQSVGPFESKQPTVNEVP